MAEFRSITPRNLFKDRYIPENDPSWREGQDRISTNPILGAGERALDAYREFKTNSAIDVYRFALANGKTEEEAQALARDVLRGVDRSELIASILAPEALGAGVGKVTSGIDKAVDLARSLMGGRKAAEPRALLEAPRRNAMFADEMLEGEILPPSPSYSGPRRLESGEFLPRIDIPTVRGSGITAKDVVSSPFDDIGRLVGEGGQADETIEAARRMVRDRIAAEEAFRARQADTMVGEGGTAPNEAARLRALKAAEDAALTARQMGTAEGEGMATADAVDIAKAVVQRRLEAQAAAHQARLDRMADDGAGMAITNTPAARPSLPALAREPGTGFTLGESSGAYSPNFTMPGASRTQAGSFGPLATRGSSDVVGGYRPISEGSYDVPAILRMLGGAGMGGGATATALNAARDMQRMGASAETPSALMAFSDDVRSETPGVALTGGPSDEGRASYNPIYTALEKAASRAPAAPATRRAEPAAPPASRALWEAYNRSMMDEGGGRGDLFVRADRAEMEERRRAEEGRARGGAARANGGAGGKDAALHKALEIIQHMLVNR